MPEGHAEVRLSREMSLLDVTLIGVGAMIGAGIFVLTGIAAGVAGPALIVAFALNAVISLCTAMVYAELGSCFHDAGGGYLWVKRGLPDPNGFLSGWMSWFAHAVACSLYALGFGAYFSLVVRMLGYGKEEHLPFGLEKLLAVGVVVLFGFINYRGASETGKAGNIVTAAKLIVLAVFVAFGAGAMFRNPEWTANFQDFLPRGWSGVFMAMGLTFIAFEGYEIIAQCSEEVENPRRNIPRAVFYSLAIVVPIYLLVAWVALGAVNGGGLPAWQFLAEKKEVAMVEAARQFFVGGGLMILIGGLLSTMSALNATIFSSSRVAFAMARDHNLPSFFSRLSSRRKTPHVAIFFSMLIIIAILLWLPIEDVASAADIMFLLLFLQVNAAIITIRRKMPRLDRGFTIPLFPLIPVLGILGNLFIAMWLFRYSPVAWLAAAAWIGVGFLLHRFYAGPKEEQAVERIEGVERLERKEYRVLVALSSPRNAPSVVEVGSAIARRHGGEMVVLAVREVPEDQPLFAGLGERDALDELVEAGVAQARKAGLVARGLIKVSHRVSRGIVETAREEKCNFIVLGRRRRQDFLQSIFATAVDHVISQAPCHVAVVGGTVRRGIVRRVVPAFPEGDLPRLALELAPVLADWCDADIRPLAVVPQLASREETQQFRTEAEQRVSEIGLEVRPALVRNDDVADAVLESCDAGDLVLMDTLPSGMLSQLLAPPAPQDLMDRGVVPVVMFRRHVDRERGWLSRVLAVG